MYLESKLESLGILENKKPIEIGGWLILVAIGVILSPLNQLYFIVTAYPPLFSGGSWQVITSESSANYIPYLGEFIIGEIVINSIIALIDLYLIYLFFTKKINLPKWYLIAAVFSISFIIFDAYVVSFLTSSNEVFDLDTLKEMGGSLFAVLIWTPYLFYSQRSKNTFVNERT
jgi:hypothetical protein